MVKQSCFLKNNLYCNLLEMEDQVDLTCIDLQGLVKRMINKKHLTM
jgi:hypothetical protein